MRAKPPNPGPPINEARRLREAEALRDNLRRRKEQQRARQAPAVKDQDSQPSTTPPEPTA